MSGRVVLTYHPLYDGRGFSPVVRSWGRYRAALELFETLGLFRVVETIRQAAARPEDLISVHPEQYVDFVRRRDRDGRGYLDDRETPAWRGVFERALVAVGGRWRQSRWFWRGRSRTPSTPAAGCT
ncbi:MAG TPA: hypothetical protein VGW38_13675, partial [Chloroflexota bacterium]|nr:hypothetical protein [Chloroflexota bacterium]